MEAEVADKLGEAILKLRKAGENAKKHEKRKERIKLNELLADASEKVEKSYDTEMHLLRKRSDNTFVLSKSKNREINGKHHNSAVHFNNLSRIDSDSSFVTALSQNQAMESSRDVFDSGFMRRASVRLRSISQTKPEPWKLVESIALESKNLHRRVATKYKVSSGRWRLPSLQRGCRGLRRKISSLLLWTNDNSSDATDLMARDSVFAIGQCLSCVIEASIHSHTLTVR